jgi:uncharacterized protein YyaL (SSP411 family)
MKPNALIHESSLYLQQHAHNPVDWKPWSQAAFDTAREENKLVLVSIGYSACHWCHVMEHECFENEELASYMNQHFVCIKVDREERPDIDQIYMTAVQLMTQRGGWPLNCFTLPDGRPIYGGTYFPKDQWMNVLKSLVYTQEKDPERVLEYATQLEEGISQSELIAVPQAIEKWNEEKLHEMLVRWSRNFDNLEGGPTKAPKFPLPNNYLFLMEYAKYFQDEKVRNHVELTLDKMLYGGIYDQIGGGFARYSVDMLWKVPHFEKMLYDNGQLVQLYSEAYRYLKKDSYKTLVYQTVAWLEREMLDSSGAFYSALDADTEGEEGKFYCWSKEELQRLLSKDFEWVKDYYNVNQRGYWEEEKYILLRTESDAIFAKKQNWTIEELRKKVEDVNSVLLHERNKRTRPGLDTKCLSSWNALTITGLCSAFQAFEDDQFLLLARKAGNWLLEKQIKEDTLYRNYSKGVTSIEGFLEDYAIVIEAFNALYKLTAELKWLETAKLLTEKVEREFQHPESKMCFFTTKNSVLITRKMELNDNVLPASNSIMANNFLFLGYYFRQEKWIASAEQMLANLYDGMEQYGSGYSNWGLLLLRLLHGVGEIVTIDNTRDVQQSIAFNLNTYSIATFHLEIPNSENHKSDGIYVCKKGVCFAPVQNIKELEEIISI